MQRECISLKSQFGCPIEGDEAECRPFTCCKCMYVQYKYTKNEDPQCVLIERAD